MINGTPFNRILASLLVVSLVILAVNCPKLTAEASTSPPIEILEILPSEQADNALLELRPSHLSEFTGSEFTIEIWTNAPTDQAISAVRVSLDSVVENNVEMVFGKINLIAAASDQPYPSGSFRFASVVFGGLKDTQDQNGSKVEFDFFQSQE